MKRSKSKHLTECLGHFTINNKLDVIFEGEISFVCKKCMMELLTIYSDKMLNTIIGKEKSK